MRQDKLRQLSDCLHDEGQLPRTKEEFEFRLKQMDSSISEAADILKMWVHEPYSEIAALSELTADYLREAKSHFDMRVYADFKDSGKVIDRSADRQNWEEIGPRLDRLSTVLGDLLTEVDNRAGQMRSEFDSAAKYLRSWSTSLPQADASQSRKKLEDIARNYPAAVNSLGRKPDSAIATYAAFLNTAGELIDFYAHLRAHFESFTYKSPEQSEAASQQCRALIGSIDEKTRDYTGVLGRKKEFALNEIKADLRNLSKMFTQQAELYRGLESIMDAAASGSGMPANESPSAQPKPEPIYKPQGRILISPAHISAAKHVESAHAHNPAIPLPTEQYLDIYDYVRTTPRDGGPFGQALEYLLSSPKPLNWVDRLNHLYGHLQTPNAVISIAEEPGKWQKLRRVLGDSFEFGSLAKHYSFNRAFHDVADKVSSCLPRTGNAVTSELLV